MTTKRFVIRKSLIGKDVTITFVNKKGETVKYSHDDVYNKFKERFDSMNCYASFLPRYEDSVVSRYIIV